jgi:hypothetical protein
MDEETDLQLKGLNKARLASSFIGRNLAPIIIVSTFASLGLFFIIDKFFGSLVSAHEWLAYMFMAPLLLLLIIWTVGMTVEFFAWALKDYREHRSRGGARGAAMIYVLVPALVIIAFLVLAMWEKIRG